MSTQRPSVARPKILTSAQPAASKSVSPKREDGHTSSSSSRSSSFLTTPNSSANSHATTSYHDYAHYLTYGPTTHSQERAIAPSPELVGLARKSSPFVKRQIDVPSAGRVPVAHSSKSNVVVTGRSRDSPHDNANPALARTPSTSGMHPSSSIPFPRTRSVPTSNSPWNTSPAIARYPTISSVVSSAAKRKPRLGPHHFLVSRQVAKGGFGRVYQGTEVQSGQIVAIKTVQRAGLARHRVDAVLKEQIISKKVSGNRSNCNNGSEFVVKMVSSFLTPSHFVFVLEYHGAGDLRDVDYPLKTEDARFYIGEMALGLRYLHSQNIVLRDLKPGNALLGFDGHVRLADFGLATMVDPPLKQPKEKEKEKDGHERERTASVLSFTTRGRAGSLLSMAESFKLPKLSLGGGRKRSNTSGAPSNAALGRSKSWNLGNAKMARRQQRTVLCGTPGYISPEGYHGKHGPEGDIWALGITLFEFITGVNPFDTWGEPTKEIKSKVLYGDPFYPEGMPADTQNILERLLRKKWKKRATLDELMIHPFFRADDHFWERLQKKEIKPPPLPEAACERLQRTAEFPRCDERSEMPLILYLEQEAMRTPNESFREVLSNEEADAFYMDEIDSLSPGAEGSDDTLLVWR